MTFTDSTMFIVSYDSSVDPLLLKEKGILSFTNYEDMKTYMDDCIWELRFSDLEINPDNAIVGKVKDRFSKNKHVGYIHFENSYMELYIKDKMLCVDNMSKGTIPYAFMFYYIQDLQDNAVIAILEI